MPFVANKEQLLVVKKMQKIKFLVVEFVKLFNNIKVNKKKLFEK